MKEETLTEKKGEISICSHTFTTLCSRKWLCFSHASVCAFHQEISLFFGFLFLFRLLCYIFPLSLKKLFLYNILYTSILKGRIFFFTFLNVHRVTNAKDNQYSKINNNNNIYYYSVVQQPIESHVHQNDWAS